MRNVRRPTEGSLARDGVGEEAEVGRVGRRVDKNRDQRIMPSGEAHRLRSASREPRDAGTAWTCIVCAYPRRSDSV